MTASLATVSYIAATILFILSLGGLANPETARRGNLFGMIGMALAVVATVLGPRVTPPAQAAAHRSPADCAMRRTRPCRIRTHSGSAGRDRQNRR